MFYTIDFKLSNNNKIVAFDLIFNYKYAVKNMRNLSKSREIELRI